MKTIKSIVRVAMSNIASIIAGIIVSFIIPKVTEIEGYGFYKTFTLYVTYVGIFSLGIVDGIVLEYGGIDYNDFNKPFFRSVFKHYSLIHLFWAFILMILSLTIHESNHKFIIFMIAIYMYFGNMIGYFQQISQITQRFKEYSNAKMIQSGMKILSGLIMIAIYFVTKRLVNYRLYILFLTLELVLVTIGYFFIYRQIIFGKADSLFKTKKHVIKLIKTGFPLLVANLCSTLILTLDRQFVNLLFPNSEYAVYAFAYNMLSLVTVATSAISTVLYPVLKRTTEENLQKNYSNLISTILVLVYGSLVAYFPLCKFVEWFLPKYTNSLPIFRIIFPGLAISSSVNIVMHNYYKTLGKNIIFFKKSIMTLVFSVVANGLAYYLYGTTISISVASIITMIIWYLYVEQFFVKKYSYKRWENFFYIIVMTIVFYLITTFKNWILGGLLYFLSFIIISLTMERKVLSFTKQIINN